MLPGTTPMVPGEEGQATGRAWPPPERLETRSRGHHGLPARRGPGWRPPVPPHGHRGSTPGGCLRSDRSGRSDPRLPEPSAGTPPFGCLLNLTGMSPGGAHTITGSPGGGPPCPTESAEFPLQVLRGEAGDGRAAGSPPGGGATAPMQGVFSVTASVLDTVKVMTPILPPGPKVP